MTSQAVRHADSSLKYYSFAGEARGRSDPDETYCFHVYEDECTLRGCTKEHCDHTVMMWSGNEYSKDHTWIAAGEKALIDLEEAR